MSSTENQTAVTSAKRVVLEYFGQNATEARLHRSSRRQFWVWSRWILFRLIKEHTDLSTVQIGELLDIDSSSVRFGLLKFDDEITQNTKRRRDWENCLFAFNQASAKHLIARDGGNLHSGFRFSLTTKN